MMGIYMKARPNTKALVNGRKSNTSYMSFGYNAIYIMGKESRAAVIVFLILSNSFSHVMTIKYMRTRFVKVIGIHAVMNKLSVLSNTCTSSLYAFDNVRVGNISLHLYVVDCC